MKLLTQEIWKKMPRLGQTDGLPDEEKKIVCKFFTPDAQATWYVLEGEETNDPDKVLFFGWADLGDPEMAEYGYFSLADLEAVVGPFGLKVERDRGFTGTMADVRRMR